MEIYRELQDPFVLNNTWYPFTYGDNGREVITKINYQFIVNNDNKEDTMSLTKDYKRAKLNDDERLARDYGALGEDGTLTEKGKDLFLNILLEDEELKAKFIKAIKKIDEDE